MTTDQDIEREALDDVTHLRAGDYPGADLSGPLDVFAQPPTERRADRTLEDLYSTYPIGDGIHSLRVERVHPRIFAGQNVAGFICDLTEQITLREFQERFGGAEYAVSVRGGNKDRVGPDGMHDIRTLTKIKVSVTGPPKMTEQPRDYPRTGGSGSDAIELRRMELNDRIAREDREARLKAEAELSRRSGGLTDTTMRMVDQMAEKRANDVRESFAAQAHHQQMELTRLTELLKRRDAELEAANTKYTQFERDMTAKLYADESRHEGQLKAQHAAETERIRAELAAKLDDMRREYERRLVEQQTKFETDRSGIVKSAEDDRRRMREDMDLRERRLLEDAKDRIAMLTQNCESRLAEMERSCKREVDNVREQRDREVRSAENSATLQTTVTTQAVTLRESLMTQELNRYRTEMSALKRENEDLRAKTFKSPLEAIQEAQTLMGIVGGGEKEGDGDWKSGAVSAIKEAVKNIPDALKQFGEARQQNIAMAQAQRGGWMPPGQAPPGTMLPPGAQMQQMQPQQQRRPAARPPVPRWERPVGAPPTPEERATMGVPPPFEGPVGGAPRRAARPPAPPPMPIPQSPPQPQAAAAQPEQQPAPQQPQVAIPDEAAQEFLGRLNEAIDSGIVSPAQFAEGFVERVGPDMARGLVQSLTPQKLIEGISSEPGGDQTAIVTLEGRKFVDALWVETAKLVGTPT